jgi:hypothetical protein
MSPGVAVSKFELAQLNIAVLDKSAHVEVMRRRKAQPEAPFDFGDACPATE